MAESARKLMVSLNGWPVPGSVPNAIYRGGTGTLPLELVDSALIFGGDKDVLIAISSNHILLDQIP
jgi:hypothetical protein